MSSSMKFLFKFTTAANWDLHCPKCFPKNHCFSKQYQLLP